MGQRRQHRFIGKKSLVAAAASAAASAVAAAVPYPQCSPVKMTLSIGLKKVKCGGAFPCAEYLKNTPQFAGKCVAGTKGVTAYCAEKGGDYVGASPGSGVVAEAVAIALDACAGPQSAETQGILDLAGVAKNETAADKSGNKAGGGSNNTAPEALKCPPGKFSSNDPEYPLWDQVSLNGGAPNPNGASPLDSAANGDKESAGGAGGAGAANGTDAGGGGGGDDTPPKSKVKKQKCCFCRRCMEGKYADKVGMSECKACPAGRAHAKLQATSQTDCELCPQGRFDPTPTQGTTECLACEPGTFSSTEGLSQCTRCMTGKYLPAT